MNGTQEADIRTGLLGKMQLADLTWEHWRIDPTIARSWLDSSGWPNTAGRQAGSDSDGYQKNRRLNDRVVGRYAHAMTEERWPLTGDTIKFDLDGHLIDGQHRLHAVIVAKKPIEIIVVRGLPTRRVSALDCGRKRSVSDLLDMKGTPNSVQLGSALRLQAAYEAGQIHAVNLLQADNEEVLLLLNKHPRMPLGLMVGKRVNENLRLSPAWVTFLYYQFSYRDPVLADEFFRGLQDGTNLVPGSPVTVLRNQFVRQLGVRHHQRPPRHIEGAWIIKAWNALRNDDYSCKLFRQGWGETYPEIM